MSLVPTATATKSSAKIRTRALALYTVVLSLVSKVVRNKSVLCRSLSASMGRRLSAWTSKTSISRLSALCSWTAAAKSRLTRADARCWDRATAVSGSDTTMRPPTPTTTSRAAIGSMSSAAPMSAAKFNADVVKRAICSAIFELSIAFIVASWTRAVPSRDSLSAQSATACD